MAYFIPSFFQKRILRYALARLDLLETDTLNLENLDIAWGRTSTVELKEVGIRADKISALIELPPYLSIKKASIRILRITVPADLHRASILIEVLGVDIRLKAYNNRKHFRPTAATASKHGINKTETHDQSDDPKDSRLRTQYNSGSDVGQDGQSADSDDGTIKLPTTTDLAQSFLQTQSPEKQNELRDAVTQSQFLRQSVTSNESVTESTQIGVGNTLSLPTFLADFLQGVGDRLKARLENINIEVELALDHALDGSSRSKTGLNSEEVVIRLKVDNLAVTDVLDDSPFPDLSGSLDVVDSKRRISLQNVRCQILSAQGTPPQFAQGDSQSLPGASHPNILRSQPTQVSLSSTSTSSGQIKDLESTRTSQLPPESLNALQDSDRLSRARLDDIAISDSIISADSNQETSLTSFYSTTQEPDQIDENENNQLSSQITSDRGAYASRQQSLSSASPRDYPLSFGQSSKRLPHPDSGSAPHALPRRPDLSRNIIGAADRVNNPFPVSEGDYLPRDVHDSPNLSPPSDPSPSSSDDLEASQFFSHEQATSMYMSALSTGNQQDRSSVGIPGAWISSYANDAKHVRPEPPEPSPFPFRPDQEGNLASVLDDSVTRSSVLQSTYSVDGKDDQLQQVLKVETSSDTTEEPPYLVTPEKSSEKDSAKKDSPKTFIDIPLAHESLPLLVKTIIEIDTIDAEISVQDVSATQLMKIFDRIAPVTNADHLSGKSPLGFTSNSSGVREDHQFDEVSAPAGGSSNFVSIKVGNVLVLWDIAVIKTMISILEAWNILHATMEQRTDTHSSNKSLGLCVYGLSIKELTWNLLDCVNQDGETLSTPDASPRSNLDTKIQEPDILLTCGASDLQLSQLKLNTKMAIKGTLADFQFGYSNEPIISFNRDFKLGSSVRDHFANLTGDFGFYVNESKSTFSVDITTLPLHVTLDLRRLDDMFTWFGGLSGIVSLGNSVASTITMLDTKGKKQASSERVRGVHFERAQVEPGSENLSKKPMKITLRVGGLVVNLRGAACCMRLESTAAKAVSRSEGVGLQIDRICLQGPCRNDAGFQDCISLQLSNARIEYLPTPKEVDLSRLLAMLSPSTDRQDRDDDILLDTLLRQRRKAGVIRTTVEEMSLNMISPEDLELFPLLGEELKRLSTMTKYLPEDDRPGLMTLGLIRSFELRATVNEKFGSAICKIKNMEIAHVTFPVLVTLCVNDIHLLRDDGQDMIKRAFASIPDKAPSMPMIMARFIGNEMEPLVKLKLHGMQFEYHVFALTALFGLSEAEAVERLTSDVTSSIATLTAPMSNTYSSSNDSTNPALTSAASNSNTKDIGLRVLFRDSILGLNPHNSEAKGLLVLSEADLYGRMIKAGRSEAVFDVRKASFMAIDSQTSALEEADIRTNIVESLIASLEATGYVTLCRISAAQINLHVTNSLDGSNTSIELEIRDDLFVLETCADSTQSLAQIFNGLTPPMPKSRQPKYRTEVIPVQDMLASFTGDVFPVHEKAPPISDMDQLSFDERDMVDDDVPQNLEFVSSFYNPDPDTASLGVADSILEGDLSTLAKAPVQREIGDGNLLQSFAEQSQILPGNHPLDFRDDHFGSSADPEIRQGGGPSNESEVVSKTPNVSIRVRDTHIIWNLFDGYDWKRTRDTIKQAVAEVESKATERDKRRDRSRQSDREDESEDVIGDFLFNSIYIGIPPMADPAELTRHVNADIDDLRSETGSESTSRSSQPPSQGAQAPHRRRKSLKLTRSKHHKMTFELKGVSADIAVFPPGIGEVENFVDLRVYDLEIFDHVPTSTWKKFATYMRDAGERESGSNILHIQLQNVRPVPSLAATEIILQVAVLPLRLHVDQDALDFMARFFEFKDEERSEPSSGSDVPFIQRAEIKAIRVRLDFKPKRVDYGGLRSGRTNEFMNFFILDAADMILRHVIVYGVLGFDRLGKTLNDIWMPDIKRNQLPGVLAGLAPVRSLVNVGGGVKDLVVVPIREYRKDGRIVRSFQKGAVAFAKTTTSELMRLGAKLAIGTQTVLQSAEDLLGPKSPTTSKENANDSEEEDSDDTKKKKISLYADQPVGVIQGLRGAYASLERDLLTAKDAIVAMPGEILESDTATDVAKAVWKGAPTVILRPAMGVSKAVGQTLMGATNSLDGDNRRRIEDKYKRH